MSIEFFGTGSHKMTTKELFDSAEGVFLDVRSNEENASLALPLTFQARSLHIPLDELPDRYRDIPAEPSVGIFCSAVIRASISYAYLRTKGHANVYVLEGGYAALVEELKPGKLLKQMCQTRSIGKSGKLVMGRRT
ncbi:MAG: rhodanese-like domain-containing protein [Pirellulales bacterium]|nr:rhodanese-like domain-containing protein [Pirellulales bacterium]